MPIKDLVARKIWMHDYHERTKDRDKLARREYALKYRYGITEVKYQELVELQNGRCAICYQLPTTKRLAVDHDHTNGQIRGLLCDSCNHRLLGIIGKCTPYAVLAYLERYDDPRPY